MLRTQVYALSVSNLTDARYFAAWGVEAMGFDLQEISVMQVNAFKDWISGPKIIGQFTGIQDYEGIQDVANNLELDMVLLDPLSPKEWNFNKPVLREVIYESWTPEHDVVYVVKSGDPHFSIQKNVKELRDRCQHFSCILDLNIDLQDLETILEDIRPLGLVLRGGDEEKVGFKSYDELDEIMEILDED